MGSWMIVEEFGASDPAGLICTRATSFAAAYAPVHSPPAGTVTIGLRVAGPVSVRSRRSVVAGGSGLGVVRTLDVTDLAAWVAAAAALGEDD